MYVPKPALDKIKLFNRFQLSDVTRYTVFNGVPSSCFPSSTGLGSSFDVDLAVEVCLYLVLTTHVLELPVSTMRLSGR